MCQRDRGQGVRDKDKMEIEGGGEGNREKAQESLFQRTKDCVWIGETGIAHRKNGGL